MKTGQRHADDAHVTRNEVELMRRFDQIDENGDGIHQLKEVQRWMLYETEDELNTEMRQMDSDLDGRISKREFHAFHLEL